jgi:mannose-6-phosphate isomerase class I
MDVETLVEMLEYSPNEADSFKFKAESDDGQVKVFNPDIQDFSLETTSLKDGKRDLPGAVL